MNSRLDFFNNAPTTRTLYRPKPDSWRMSAAIVNTTSFENVSRPFIDVSHTRSTIALLCGGNSIRYTYMPFETCVWFDINVVGTISRNTVSLTSNQIHSIVAGGVTVNTDQYTWQSMTNIAQASANLSAAAYYVQGCTDMTTQIHYNGTTTNLPDKIPWATLTKAAQTWTLSSNRYNLAVAADSINIMYYGGYNVGTNALAVTADKVSWATFTSVAQASANLSVAKWYHSACTNRTDVIIGGGYDRFNATQYATTEIMPWATLTTAAWTSLTSVMGYPLSVADSTNGIFAYTSVANKFNWAGPTSPLAVSGANGNPPNISYGVANNAC